MWKSEGCGLFRKEKRDGTKRQEGYERKAIFKQEEFTAVEKL